MVCARQHTRVQGVSLDNVPSGVRLQPCKPTPALSLPKQRPGAWRLQPKNTGVSGASCAGNPLIPTPSNNPINSPHLPHDAVRKEPWTNSPQNTNT